MKKLGIVLMAALTAHIAFTPVFAADAMDPKLKEKAQRARAQTLGGERLT